MATFDSDLRHMLLSENSVYSIFSFCGKNMCSKKFYALFELDHLILFYTPLLIVREHVGLESNYFGLLIIKTSPTHLHKYYQGCYVST